jgi:hypothetical protein
MRFLLPASMTCSLLLCLGLVTAASSSDNIGKTPSGKTIQGEVLRVEGDYVSVKSHDTGEIVRLHIDKNTEKRDIHLRPTPGTNVIAKYDEQTNHAISFLTDQVINR